MNSKYSYVKHIIVSMSMLVLVIILYKCVGFYYAINDDITMQQLTAGYYTGNPDGHLAKYIYYIYGYVIELLFEHFPGIDWYGGVLIALNFLCYWIIIVRILKITENKSNKWFIRLFCLVIIIAACAESTVIFQFTVVSGLLSATALFLLVTADKNDSPWMYGFIWCLYLVSTMLRVKMIFMLAPLFVLICTYKVYTWYFVVTDAHLIRKFDASGNNKRRIVEYAIITIMGIVAYLGMNVIENAAYSNETWKAYTEYNHYRSMIMDYYGWPSYEGNEKFWESENISEEEWNCLMMFGVLPDIDSNKIKDIAEYSKSIYVDKTVKQKLANGYGLLLKAFDYDAYKITNFILLMVLICVCISLRKKQRISQIAIVGGVIIQIAILLYLLYKGRLPARIVTVYDYQCIFSLLGVLLLNQDFGSILFKRKYIKVLLATVAGVASSFLLIYSVYRTNSAICTYKEKINVYEEIIDYMNANSGDIFVSSSGSIEMVKQYAFFDDKEPANWFGSYGWSSKSPWYAAGYENLGIDPESHILLNKGVCFITSDINNAENINKYYYSENLIDKKYVIKNTVSLSNEKELYVVSWN